MAERLKQPSQQTNRPKAEFPQWQSDPIGFCEEHFHEEYTDDQKEMMLSVRDNPVTVCESANGVGKSHGAARVAVWFYKTQPSPQVYTAAAPPIDNLSRILWGEIGTLVHRHPQVFQGDKTGPMILQRNPLSFLTGVTIPSQGTEAERTARFSGKHAPSLLFILDEGDAIPFEVYVAIESCLSGGLMVRLLILLNPRDPSGPVWRMTRDGQAKVVNLSALTHPNVVTGENKVPGAVTREVTVRRINEWSRPVRDGDKLDEGASWFEVPEYLQGSVAVSNNGRQYPPLEGGVRLVTDPQLDVMTLARYPAQSQNQLISRAWVMEAVARGRYYRAQYGERPPQGVRPVIGQDVGEFGNDPSVACTRWGGFTGKLKRWASEDPLVTAENAAGIYKETNARLVNVDSTGVGSSVVPSLLRMKVRANRVMVGSSPTEKVELGEFDLMRDQLWWMAREWLRTDPSAMLPDDELLIEDLLAMKYSFTPRGRKITVTSKDELRKVLKRSTDSGDAFVLTFATENRGSEGVQQFNYRGMSIGTANPRPQYGEI